MVALGGMGMLDVCLLTLVAATFIVVHFLINSADRYLVQNSLYTETMRQDIPSPLWTEADIGILGLLTPKKDVAFIYDTCTLRQGLKRCVHMVICNSRTVAGGPLCRHRYRRWFSLTYPGFPYLSSQGTGILLRKGYHPSGLPSCCFNWGSG